MNISNLEHYVEQKNSWSKLFGKRPLSLLNAQDRQTIANSIDADLSPENLSCDGERPASEVRARYNFLTRAASELKALYPAVKMYEVM